MDSKLRGCDLVRLKVEDIFAAGYVKDRTSIIQSKKKRPEQFEITETTRLSLETWLNQPEMMNSKLLWPSRLHKFPHISTRQYAQLLICRVSAIGLKPSAFGTHSMRRTKAAQIHKKTVNLRTVQLLLGNTKKDSTVRCHDVELDDALEIAEKAEIWTL